MAADKHYQLLPMQLTTRKHIDMVLKAHADLEE